MARNVITHGQHHRVRKSDRGLDLANYKRHRLAGGLGVPKNQTYVCFPWGAISHDLPPCRGQWRVFEEVIEPTINRSRKSPGAHVSTSNKSFLGARNIGGKRTRGGRR